jgi:hypothetical protein
MGDELGNRSANLLLASPKHRHLLELLPVPLGNVMHPYQMAVIYKRHGIDQAGPSREAIVTFEEMRALNLPSIGLRKAPDLLLLFGSSAGYATASKMDAMSNEELSQWAASRRTQLTSDANALASSRPLVPPASTVPLRSPLPSPQQPGGTAKVLSTVVSAMLSNAQNLEALSSSLQSTSSSSARRPGNSSSHEQFGQASILLDRGYMAASLCSEWKRRVPIAIEVVGEDERSVSQLMQAADIVNSALQTWQVLAVDAIGGEAAANHSPLLPPFQRGGSSRPRSLGKGADLLGLDELVISSGATTSNASSLPFPSNPPLSSPSQASGSQPDITSLSGGNRLAPSSFQLPHVHQDRGSRPGTIPYEMEEFDNALSHLLSSTGHGTGHSFCPRCQAPCPCISQEAASQLRHVVMRIVEGHQSEVNEIKAAAVKKFKELNLSQHNNDSSLL